MTKNTCTKIGKLQWEDGWMGGKWTLNGKEFKPHHLPNKVIVDLRGKYLDAKPYKVHGSDYDHGHTYEWDRFSLMVEIPTDIGVIKIDVLELLCQFKRRKFIVTILQES